MMKLLNYPYVKIGGRNWSEIFRNPRNIHVSSFQTGTVKINLLGTINPDHPLAGDIPEEKLDAPILAHWVHHEEKGDFLVDAGLDASYLTDPRGGLKGSAVDEFELVGHENIAFYIQDNHIKLKTVFLSHLHADHAAGVRELSKDIPYVVPKGEYDQYRPEIHGNFLEGLEELYELDFSGAIEIHPLGPSVDILGDGSLWAIWTPGHTQGHMSFLVNGMEGPILLAMDAAFIHKNLERGVAPSDYTWNVEKAQETLEKITEFLREYPKVKVVPGHEDLKRTIEIG